MRRLLSPVLVVAGVLAGCYGSDGSDAGGAEPTTTTAPAGTTPSTNPVIVLAVAEELALVAGQCWGPLPTPQPETTVPASLTVAVVDCSGARAGLVYGNGCLGAEPHGAREPVSVVACPGRSEDSWPGQRALQRAAVSACLPLFEDQVGERFATTDLEAIELLPSEQLWAQGERRYVCTAQPPTPE